MTSDYQAGMPTAAALNLPPAIWTDGRRRDRAVTKDLVPFTVHMLNPLDAPSRGAWAATVVLPAYNEERGLSALLPSLLELSRDRFEVVVVDDGSTDATASLAESFGCRVVRHAANAGKGVAVRTGLIAARGEKVIVMDADDTYPVDAVVEIIDRLDDCEMVVGTRTLGRKNIPLLNRFGNALLTSAIRLASGSRWTDPLTGLYGLRRSALERLDLRSTGFSLEAEIAIKSAGLGLRVVDHPIVYRARAGASKLHPVRDGIRIAAVINSLGMQRLARSCLQPIAPFFR
jgi:glycosyltransferase involved in cell wall biosynthesis